MDIEHRQIGILVPFFEQGDRKIVGAWARSQRETDVAVEVLDRKETLEAEPLLLEQVTGAIRFPEPGHVNPRTLVVTLALAARRHGEIVVTDSPVHAVLHRGREGVRRAGWRWRGQHENRGSRGRGLEQSFLRGAGDPDSRVSGQGSIGTRQAGAGFRKAHSLERRPPHSDPARGDHPGNHGGVRGLR